MAIVKASSISLQPTPIAPSKTQHQGDFHGHKGAAPNRHVQRQACPAQGSIPMTMLMHHGHSHSRLETTSDPVSSKTGAIPEHFPFNQGPGAKACPTSNHQFSATEMVFRGGLPIVCLRHIIGLMTFKKESINIKTNPVGEGREPF